MISQSHWSSFAIDHRLQDRFTIEEATRDYAIGAERIDNRLDQLYSGTASRPSTLDAVHGVAWVLARYRSRGDDFLGENVKLGKIFLALRAFQRLERFDHRAEGRRWCFTLNIGFEPLLRFDRLEPAALAAQCVGFFAASILSSRRCRGRFPLKCYRNGNGKLSITG
jgi:hypothetical protein